MSVDQGREHGYKRTKVFGDVGEMPFVLEPWSLLDRLFRFD